MATFIVIVLVLTFIGVVTALGQGSMNAWDDDHPVRAVLLGTAAVLVFAGGLAFALEGGLW